MAKANPSSNKSQSLIAKKVALNAIPLTKAAAKSIKNELAKANQAKIEALKNQQKAVEIPAAELRHLL